MEGQQGKVRGKKGKGEVEVKGLPQIQGRNQ